MFEFACLPWRAFTTRPLATMFPTEQDAVGRCAPSWRTSLSTRAIGARRREYLEGGLRAIRVCRGANDPHAGPSSAFGCTAATARNDLPQNGGFAMLTQVQIRAQLRFPIALRPWSAGPARREFPPLRRARPARRAAGSRYRQRSSAESRAADRAVRTENPSRPERKVRRPVR